MTIRPMAATHMGNDSHIQRVMAARKMAIDEMAGPVRLSDVGRN